MPRRTVAVIALLIALPACRGALENQGVPDGDAGSNQFTVNNETPNDETPNDETPNNENPNNENPNNETPNNETPNNETPNNETPNNEVADMGEPPDVSEPPFDAGPCDGAGFGDEFTVTAVPTTTAQGRLHATGTSGGGAILAWRDGSGVHLTHVDGTGGVVADHTVAGSEIYGLAATDDARAVMVSRDSDILALAILDDSGAVVSDQTIIGDVPHDVTNNEWFGPLIREGRMIWTGSQWATYFTVQRLWDDGVAHYGDQLRLYEADGSSNQMVWNWGCSHSMEVRISHNGDRLGPVCSSDCFPSKGVHFNHRGGQLWPDESGSNCAGGYGTSLGASVPVTGGFWLAFTATDDRDSADVAIVKVDGSSPGAPIWLTEDATRDDNLNAVSFDGDLLVAWDAAGSNQFTLRSVDTGAELIAPVSIPDAALASSSDFFEFANGDVGWAQPASDGSVGLARLRACR